KLVEAPIAPAAAEVSRVDECRACRVQLRDEGVEVAAVVGRVERPGGRREVARGRESYQVSAACPVHSDSPSSVASASTYVGGLDQRGTGGIQLRDEGVEVAAAVGAVECPGSRWKV